MQQIRVQRKNRRSGGGDDPSPVALPTSPVRDTSRAADLIARIDRMVDGR